MCANYLIKNLRAKSHLPRSQVPSVGLPHWVAKKSDWEGACCFASRTSLGPSPSS
jgi:hypothetical protein